LDTILRFHGRASFDSAHFDDCLQWMALWPTDVGVDTPREIAFRHGILAECHYKSGNIPVALSEVNTALVATSESPNGNHCALKFRILLKLAESTADDFQSVSAKRSATFAEPRGK
jgi:hypothetical protein